MADELQCLKDVVVVQLGVGMAPALVVKFVAELGATVVRVEPPGGDPFARMYPAYDIWLAGATNDTEAGRSEDRLHALLARADVCLIGGEDYPGVERRWQAAELSARYPGLVVLDLEAAPPGTEHAGRPATEVLMQARSGLVYEHYNNRPIVMSFSPVAYAAALRGLAALFAALYERELSGQGQAVATSLFEGALSWLTGLWSEVEKPTANTKFVNPKEPFPLVFRCADGVYVHLVIGGVGSKYRMYQALEIDDPTVTPEDSGMPKPTADLRNFYGDIDVLSAHAAKKSSRELLERIWALGLPAEPVMPPGKCWEEPQIRHNGVITTLPDGRRHVGHPLRTTRRAASYRKPAQAGERPLDGVRVVDFGAFVAGPYASVLLADLGADVVKVETPQGDPNRSIFRFYSAANRGKRAISIDLKQSEGLTIARELCAAADVVMSNFRPGAAARLGIDAASLGALKPELITLESPAYGSSGPLAERAGFDMVMQAYCGHEYLAGGKDNAPLWNRTSMVDFTGGFLGAIGTLASLYHRARHGDGASIDCPLVNAGILLVSGIVQRPDGAFEGTAPLSSSRTGYHPAEALYEAADGWVALSVRGQQMAIALASVLELNGALGAEPLAWGAREAESIAGAIRHQGMADLIARCEAAGVWAEACRKGVERAYLTDPAMQAANAVQVSTHPQFGEIRELGAMVRFSRSRAGQSLHAPLRGESTYQLLGELGYTSSDIDRLAERKVVA